MPSIKQVLPTIKNKFVGATSGRPRANAVRPYGKGQRTWKFSVLFHTPCPARYSVLHFLDALSGGNEPPFTQGRADYNNKCNTRKKYRQYSHQGVKCSHHNKQLHGGKNIVLHTFYTIWARKSTVFLESRKKFSRNRKNYGEKSLYDQSRSQKKLE